MAFISEAIKIPSCAGRTGMVGLGLLVSEYIGIRGALNRNTGKTECSKISAIIRKVSNPELKWLEKVSAS